MHGQLNVKYWHLVSHDFTEIRVSFHKAVSFFSSQNLKHLDPAKLLKFVRWKYAKQSY